MTGTDTKNKSYRKPLRSFEKSGLVNPEISYHVPLINNVVNSDGHDIKAMVDQGRYFSIFAPRQSGKTTFLADIQNELHNDPTYVVMLLSFERYKDLDKKEFYELIEEELYDQLINRLDHVNCDKTETVRQFLNDFHLDGHISFGRLFARLNKIIQFKKIVIFIDEFDGIPVSELENFLTALRDLYQRYKKVKQKALYSIGLIGIRNITRLVVGGVSPFNIADQVEMPPFTPENVRHLYGQYTEETNQPFSEEAIDLLHKATRGQPWLINRLGTILTVNVKPQTLEPIRESDVEEAIKLLLNEKNAHFDNLYEKAKLYKETFIEIVFDHVGYNPDNEDQGWLEQYGLIKKQNGHAVVANPIYKSRYVKTFFKEMDAYPGLSPHDYMLPGNRLDMIKVLLHFERYITQIGVNAFYKEEKPYEKTGQFLLTAWLYQFVSGGNGELRYELPSGIGRMDILLTYQDHKYIIETKINRHNLERTIEDGVAQVAEKYLASEKVDEGFLVVFDLKTAIGTACEPVCHQSGDKKTTRFIVGIGKVDCRC